jgi:hypothetical protein
MSSWLVRGDFGSMRAPHGHSHGHTSIEPLSLPIPSVTISTSQGTYGASPSPWPLPASLANLVALAPRPELTTASPV